MAYIMCLPILVRLCNACHPTGIHPHTKRQISISHLKEHPICNASIYNQNPLLLVLPEPAPTPMSILLISSLNDNVS